MNKIEFQDYPSTETPLNAENLNQMQDNIEDAINVKKVTTSGTNLDDYKETGSYYFSSSYTPVNIPVGVNGWLVVMGVEENAVKQLWFRWGTANSNDMNTFVRTYMNGEWSNWVQYQTGEKNIITVAISSNYTTTTNKEELLPLSTVKNKEGNNLTLENGVIKIGKGISKIKVSAKIEFSKYGVKGQRVGAVIKKGTTSQIQGWARAVDEWVDVNIPSYLISVAEGDEIGLYAYSQETAGSVVYQGSTYITVETI